MKLNKSKKMTIIKTVFTPKHFTKVKVKRKENFVLKFSKKETFYETFYEIFYLYFR